MGSNDGKVPFSTKPMRHSNLMNMKAYKKQTKRTPSGGAYNSPENAVEKKKNNEMDEKYSPV